MDNSSHTNRFMASLMDGLKDAATYNSMTPDQRLYVDKFRVDANQKIETLYDEMNFQAKEIARLRAEVEALKAPGYVRVHQIKLTGDSEPAWRDASEDLYCLTEEHKRRVVYIAATKETSHD